jgi:hypothetical protein
MTNSLDPSWRILNLMRWTKVVSQLKMSKRMMQFFLEIHLFPPMNLKCYLLVLAPMEAFSHIVKMKAWRMQRE